MMELVQKVATTLAGYTAGETFTSNQGNQVSIAYHTNTVPPKESGAEDIPFCWVHRKTFTLFPRPTVQVAAEFVVYEATDNQAEEEAQRLYTLLNQLQRAGQFSPWKLDVAEGFEGEESTGIHPPGHRIYTYLLDFSGAL